MTEEDKAYFDEKFARVDEKFAHVDEKFAHVDAKFAHVDAKFADIDAKFEELKTYVDERVEKTETKLLTAFHGWARSMEIRTRVVSSSVSGMDERLALAEERISELERRKAS